MVCPIWTCWFHGYVMLFVSVSGRQSLMDVFATCCLSMCRKLCIFLYESDWSNETFWNCFLDEPCGATVIFSASILMPQNGGTIMCHVGVLHGSMVTTLTTNPVKMLLFGGVALLAWCSYTPGDMLVFGHLDDDRMSRQAKTGGGRI